MNMTIKTPKRIQRQRTKGWRMPQDAIYVGRPTKWGNPWKVGVAGTAAHCVSLYHEWYLAQPAEWLATVLTPLRGHDLACWCPLTDKNGNRVPCHADVLMELANREREA